MNLQDLVPACGQETFRALAQTTTDILSFLRLSKYVYVCPVCHTRVKDFKPIPDSYIKTRKKHQCPLQFKDFETLNYKHYSCPKCGATDRDRLISLYVSKALDLHDTEEKISLLDIAPSLPLINFFTKNNKIKYWSVDLLMDNVDEKVDITDMSTYSDNFFDAFICSHVLEHIPDDVKALAELKRVLKQDGWGILLSPIDLSRVTIDEDPSIIREEDRWRRFGQFDHVRVYSKQGFLQRVQGSGFHVTELGIDFFGEKVFQSAGVSKTSILYVIKQD